MIKKIYPADQLDQYLLLDILAFVFLAYHVFKLETLFNVWVSLGLLAIFFVAYYFSLWVRDWKLLAAFLVSCGVLSVWAVFYSEWLLIFGFIPADLLGRARLKREIYLGVLGILMMYLITFYVISGNPLSFTVTYHLPVLVLQMALPFVIRIKEQSKSLKKDLQIANKKLEKYIQEEERNRIARDLHDTLGQTLTMIKLKSELAVHLMDRDAQQAKKEIQEIKTTTRHALRQVRELVTSMKFVSLKGELTNAEKLLQVAGIQFTVREATPKPILSKVTETMLALSVREAFTNIIKHSHASQCRVSLEMINGYYEIAIKDNGKPIISTEIRGHGLDSIAERMRLIGGSADIAGSTQSGFVIYLKVPISK